MIGASSCLYMVYEGKLGEVTVLVRLNEAVDILTEKQDLSTVITSMHRFKSKIFELYDVEAQAHNLNYETESVQSYNVNFENFISSLLSLET